MKHIGQLCINNKMVTLNPTTSVITLNTNVLNTPN